MSYNRRLAGLLSFIERLTQYYIMGSSGEVLSCRWRPGGQVGSSEKLEVLANDTI
jgi:hypothetical protein